MAAPVKILALGSSLTQGYGLSPGTEFPVQLQAALKKAGIDAVVTNAGVSADTSAGGLARLDWSLADHPDAVILELGSNDMLRAIRLVVDTADRIDTVDRRIELTSGAVLSFDYLIYAVGSTGVTPSTVPGAAEFAYPIAELECAVIDYIRIRNTSPKPFTWVTKASTILARVRRASLAISEAGH